ncbi:MAG TPA: VCBS repeat-containing protein [Pyrinomonadaceae bacterium]
MHELLAASLAWALALLSAGCQARGPQPPAGARRAEAPLFAPAPGAPLDLGARPEDVAVGDWDGDGKRALVTCYAGDTVKAFLGDGRGGYRPAPGPPFSVAAHTVAVGDVNKDGRADLALAHHDSFGVVVLLGAGDGRFAPAPGSPFEAYRAARPHNHGLTLADLNADGSLDLVTSNHNDDSVSVLLGDGRGGFRHAPGSPFAAGRGPYPHAVGDVNGDGRPDIVAPDLLGAGVSVLLGDGRGGFAQAAGSPHAVTSRPYYVAVGDVSGDARPDIVATHDDVTTMSTLLGDGRGAFAAASTYDLGRSSYRVIAADLDGDARAELVIGGQGSVTVLLWGARGAYTHAAGSPYAVGGDPRVALGDVNGDGRPDIVAADASSTRLTVLSHK